MSERSFADCSFKITIPSVSVLDGKVNIAFRISAQSGSQCKVALVKVYLSDTLGRYYCQDFSEVCTSAKKTSGNIEIDVPIEGKKFLLSRSDLSLVFLASDGYKYDILYRSDKETGIILKNVSKERASENEEDALKIYETKSIDIQEYKPKKVKADLHAEPKPVREKTDNTALELTKGTKHEITTLEQYRNALLREKIFLQKEGGRKHVLSNGKRLNNHEGYSTYCFELEAELNLTDDAPITFTVGNEKTNGSVVFCEGFQIVIRVERDYGFSVSRAFLGVEPWKLLEALADKLMSISLDDQMAVKLMIEGAALGLKSTPGDIPRGQKAAIDSAMKNPITVIWGPPGTGKTYTMAQIAKRYLLENKSILVVSHSNVSVDGIVKQTVQVLNNSNMSDYLTKGKVLRYGYVRDEKLSKEPNAVAYNYVLNKYSQIKERMEQLQKEKAKLSHTNKFLSAEGERVETEMKKLRVEIRKQEKEYVAKALFVATTISKVIIDPIFEDRHFDVVMFDEVSMAYIPQVYYAAKYAKEKLVLVGDFRQLPPIYQAESNKKELGDDIFEDLGISKGDKICAHPWLVMLDEQRRMHPDISLFVNRRIYKNMLKDHPSMINERNDIVARRPIPNNAISIVNMSGTYCASAKNSDNSRFNILSAIIAFKTALEAEKNGEKSAGIISPYAAQNRLIRAMIIDHNKKDKTELECSTIHQFQGSERNVIVFDPVESYPFVKTGVLMSKNMYSVLRLINVAVTRARGKFIMIGNVRFWEAKFGDSQHILVKLIKHIQENGKEISCRDKELHRYIQEQPDTRNIHYYENVINALEKFGNDLQRATERIIISIPDGKLKEETQGEILKIILGAAQTGVTILSKAVNYQDLPDKWKNITWASENAIFPLILIDDDVLWYGLPDSRGLFVDGTMSYTTVCPTIYRITGEHTIEIIKTFAEIDIKAVNGNKQSLKEKKENSLIKKDDDDGKEASGLDRYIREHDKCTECKNPMMLSKGKSGAAYIKCTKRGCKGSKILTPDYSNMIINCLGLRCPTHGCYVTAKLGKYGIYILCDRGHYLKPEEL